MFGILISKIDLIHRANYFCLAHIMLEIHSALQTQKPGVIPEMCPSIFIYTFVIFFCISI